MAETAEHIHDATIEGPLPAGFPEVGREGKVRNVYEAGALVCLIASDRVSAFDQVSPTPIPGKGELLNAIAKQELDAAEAAGIPTWAPTVPADNPRAAVGTKAEVLKAEMIYRNYMTGSMWREYQKSGDFLGYGLDAGLQEWHHFAPAILTPSTKAEKDVNFNPWEAQKMTGIDPKTFHTMAWLGRRLFVIGTQRAAERGLVLVDTKYEMGIDPDGRIIVIDEVHTPDSSRFVRAEGFAEAVAAGQRPRHLSKEFLREVLLNRTGGDVDQAKALMAQELEPDIVDEVTERYMDLYNIFTK